MLLLLPSLTSVLCVNTDSMSKLEESGVKELDNDGIKKLKEWAEFDYPFSGTLTIPSVGEMKKYMQSLGYSVQNNQLKLIRNTLEPISKFKKMGNTYSKRNKYWIPSFVPRPGWVHLDIGFIGQNRKKYGEFILAVDALTQRVKLKTFSKKAKTTRSLRLFIIDLMNDNFFKDTYRILTDGESGISVNLMSELKNQFPQLTIIKLPYNIHTKSFVAERKIRSFKSKLSRLCLLKKIPLFKWRNRDVNGQSPAQIVVDALNRTKIVNGYSPDTITQDNVFNFIEALMKTKKKYTHSFLYGMSFPQSSKLDDKIFKYKVGDRVLVSLIDHPDSTVRKTYAKATIKGHFDKGTGIFKIVSRTYTISSQNYLVIHYRIRKEGGRQILPRKFPQDSLRLAPHDS